MLQEDAEEDLERHRHSRSVGPTVGPSSSRGSRRMMALPVEPAPAESGEPPSIPPWDSWEGVELESIDSWAPGRGAASSSAGPSTGPSEALHVPAADVIELPAADVMELPAEVMRRAMAEHRRRDGDFDDL